MKRLSPSQLTDMFQLQAQLNAVVDPLWITRNFAWTRAIRVECAELSDHLGWKWWKHQDADWEQARIELVDIWHFMLSSMLVDSAGDINKAIDNLNDSLNETPTFEVINVLGHTFTFNGLGLHEAVDKLSLFASCGFIVPPLFEKIMGFCSLDWERLHSIYIAKNVLNVFRQRHGYKDGTYIKVWGGREDNEVLESIMAEHPAATPALFMEKLEEAYGQLGST